MLILCISFTYAATCPTGTVKGWTVSNAAKVSATYTDVTKVSGSCALDMSIILPTVSPDDWQFITSNQMPTSLSVNTPSHEPYSRIFFALDFSTNPVIIACRSIS